MHSLAESAWDASGVNFFCLKEPSEKARPIRSRQASATETILFGKLFVRCGDINRLDAREGICRSGSGKLHRHDSAMKRLALGQLRVGAAREVFKGLGLESVCFDMKVLEGEAEEAANQLLSRIETIITQLETLKGAGFKEEYQKRVNAKLAELKAQWDAKWRDLCNGKLLLEDMRKGGHLKGDLLRV